MDPIKFLFLVTLISPTKAFLIFHGMDKKEHTSFKSEVNCIPYLTDFKILGTIITFAILS